MCFHQSAHVTVCLFCLFFLRWYRSQTAQFLIPLKFIYSHMLVTRINTLHAKYFCRANVAVSFKALSASNGRTTGALAVTTVPIIRAVTRLLCRQEIDIETWAGPTFEAFRAVTRPIYLRYRRRSLLCCRLARARPLLSQWRERYLSYARQTAVWR